MKRWLLDSKSHFLCDSAYGSFELLQEIIDWMGDATFAISVNISQYLWDVLSAHATPNTWRAAMNDQGIVATCHTIHDRNGKLVHQQVISNAFTDNVINNENYSILNETQIVNDLSGNDIPFFTTEVLEAMTIEGLKGVCRKYNITGKKKQIYIAATCRHISPQRMNYLI